MAANNDEKLPKCGGCHQGLPVLNYSWNETTWGILHDTGEHQHEGSETIGNVRYTCPYCEALLATDEKAAIEILRGSRPATPISG